MSRVTPSTGTRSWVIESRSRTVTAPSSSESTSTVTHHGRADLVLPAIELADGRGVVVYRHRVALQIRLDPVAQLDDLGTLLEQRQDRHLVWSEVGVERQRDPLLAADLLLTVGVDQERERGPVRTRCGFDDPRDHMFVGGLVEVLELLARCLRMA